MASNTSNKPTYQTLEITLDSGEKVRVGRTSQNNLKDLIYLQDELLAKYIEANGYISELLIDKSVVDLIKQYVEFLPVVGKKNEDGSQKYLKYEDISENWEQLIKFVFNGSIDEKTGTAEDVTPSLISKLHFLPFGNSYTKYAHLQQLKMIREAKEREAAKETLLKEEVKES